MPVGSQEERGFGPSLLNQYIQQYGKRLYGLCLHLCVNPWEADDLYQETWLKALKNIARYDRRREFEPWLTKICVNTYRNTLRRVARSPIFNQFPNTEAKEACFTNLQAKENPDYSSLYEAIGQLPEKLRVTVILFYFRDMELASVADILGIPQGTVKSRLHKARKRLKEALADETDLQF